MTETAGGLDRRTVVRGAVVAGVVAAGAVVADPAAAAVRAQSRSAWAPLVGRRFTTVAHGRRVTLVLREVSDLAYRPRGLRGKRLASYRERNFVLRFDTGAVLEQRTYRVANPRLGPTRLFLVPGQRTGSRTTLTATFNRFKG